MTIGNLVRNKRIQNNLSQQELSELLGVSKVMICYIENGKRVPSATIIQKLAKSLHCSVGELFGEAAS